MKIVDNWIVDILIQGADALLENLDVPNQII